MIDERARHGENLPTVARDNSEHFAGFMAGPVARSFISVKERKIGQYHTYFTHF